MISSRHRSMFEAAWSTLRMTTRRRRMYSVWQLQVDPSSFSRQRIIRQCWHGLKLFREAASRAAIVYVCFTSVIAKFLGDSFVRNFLINLHILYKIVVFSWKIQHFLKIKSMALSKNSFHVSIYFLLLLALFTPLLLMTKLVTVNANFSFLPLHYHFCHCSRWIQVHCWMPLCGVVHRAPRKPRQKLHPCQLRKTRRLHQLRPSWNHLVLQFGQRNFRRTKLMEKRVKIVFHLWSVLFWIAIIVSHFKTYLFGQSSSIVTYSGSTCHSALVDHWMFTPPTKSRLRDRIIFRVFPRNWHFIA